MPETTILVKTVRPHLEHPEKGNRQCWPRTVFYNK